MDSTNKIRMIQILISAFPYLIMTVICIISVALSIVITWNAVKIRTIKNIKKHLPEEMRDIISDKDDALKLLRLTNKFLTLENKRYKSGYKEQDIQIRRAISELTGHKYEITLEDGE